MGAATELSCVVWVNMSFGCTRLFVLATVNSRNASVSIHKVVVSEMVTKEAPTARSRCASDTET
jgi:hypothetical protein